MNKDTLTGMVLMAVVFIGYLWWMQPSQEEIDAYKAQYQRDTRLYMELQRDPNAAVRIAREKYYMKNENEDVYVFEDEEAE